MNIRIEKRGDKYYYILPDGEIEHTEEQFLRQRIASQRALTYLETSYEIIKDANMSIDDYEKDQHVEAIIRTKIIFDTLRKDFENKYRSFENKAYLISENLRSIDIMMSELNSKIANPYSDSKVEVYQKKQLKALKKFIIAFHKNQSTAENCTDNTESTEIRAKEQKFSYDNNCKIEIPNPTLAQIALICIYTERILNKNNANTIAKEYGYTSGEKLMKHFNKYQTSTKRISSGVPKQNRQKIKDIEFVIDFFKNKEQDSTKPELELLQLNANIKNDMKNNDRY